jgi:hypothetical protein
MSVSDNPSKDVTDMDDTRLLDERRRVRETLETDPQHDHPELRHRFRQLDDEFDRRARAAWGQAS